MPKDISFSTEIKPLVLQEGLLTLSADDAEYVINNLRYERQRDEMRAQGQIDLYAEIMRRGQWRAKEVLNFAVMPDGKMILVNGHHRMRAQAAAGVSIPWVVITHDCANMKAVGDLYATFDTNIRKRSSENIVNALGLSEDFDLSKWYTNALWNAVPVIHAGLDVGNRKPSKEMTYIRRIPEDRKELALEYGEEAKHLERLTKNMPATVRKKFLSASVFSVALVTMKASPDKALGFWKGFADNDGLRRGDPRSTLIQYLLTHSASRGTMNAHVVASTLAWNAFYKGRSLNALRVNSTVAIKLAGTAIKVST